MLKGKVILKSTEGKEFEVSKSAAALSDTIRNMIEGECTDNPIHLSNITTNVLAKVVEYFQEHDVEDKDSSAKRSDSELRDWDANFIKEVKVDQDLLFDIILAADYLSIKGLLDLACKAVADMMVGKSVEEMRETFNIVNDYTPEEEAEIRSKNPWAFIP